MSTRIQTDAKRTPISAFKVKQARVLRQYSNQGPPGTTRHANQELLGTLEQTDLTSSVLVSPSPGHHFGQMAIWPDDSPPIQPKPDLGQGSNLYEQLSNIETKSTSAKEQEPLLTKVIPTLSHLPLQRQEQPKEEENQTQTKDQPAQTSVGASTTDPAKLSGKAWWDANENKAPLNKKSSDIADLEADFQVKVKEFKKALEDAGANISIDTTLRPKERAHVLHYAWQVAKGNVKASAVPAMDGVDIVWDHGDDTKSKAGAQEIITAAAVASKPSLTSNHIAGKAIDWTITWSGDLKIKKKDGTELLIKSIPRNGGDPGNTELHEVGKDYGVIKGFFTPKDPPHWSSDGK